MIVPLSYAFVAHSFHNSPYFIGIILAFFLFGFIKERFYPHPDLQKKVILWPFYFSCLLLGGTFIYNKEILLYIYPISISLSMAFSFILSLVYRPTIIESFMRIKGEKITKKHQEYALKLTVIWAIFLVLNALLSWVSGQCSFFIWTLYNGFISYLLIGLLIGGEIIYRKFFIK
ncbi:MAG: hypothetical protein HEEMFOPI_01144 [Holosporales bacterium]